MKYYFHDRHCWYHTTVGIVDAEFERKRKRSKQSQSFRIQEHGKNVEVFSLFVDRKAPMLFGFHCVLSEFETCALCLELISCKKVFI